MSLYGEPDQPATAEGSEIVIPDYSAPAADSGAPPVTAMGSGGVAPTSGGPLAQFYLMTVQPDPNATNKPAAAELANTQTIIYNISALLVVVTAFHSLMALTILNESLGDWLVVAYIITSIAAMGFFGAKHCDKTLMLAYTLSNCLWFLFMGAQNLETLGTYFYNCDTDSTGNAAAGVDQSECHRTEQEKDLCKSDPMCDADKVHFDQRHPFAEVLPDTILTILLGLGIFYGYTMYTNPAVDTTARRVAL